MGFPKAKPICWKRRKNINQLYQLSNIIISIQQSPLYIYVIV